MLKGTNARLPIWIAGALGALIVLPLAAAPAPVDEIAGSRVAAQGVPASGASELFAQLQLLQEEIRELRGKLEEQGNQLSQLEQQQKDNYLDLDGRLSALMAGGAAGAGAGAPPPVPGMPESEPQATAGAALPPVPSDGSGTAPPVPGQALPGTTMPTPPAPGGADQGAYDIAYELLKQGRMDEALSGFESFTAGHPDSALVPNAVYWMGEIYLVKNDQDAALAQFSRVAESYPGHPKAADAHYKLGTLYLQRNDKARARAHLERAVVAGGSVAALAKRYLEAHF